MAFFLPGRRRTFLRQRRFSGSFRGTAGLSPLLLDAQKNATRFAHSLCCAPFSPDSPTIFLLFATFVKIRQSFHVHGVVSVWFPGGPWLLHVFFWPCVWNLSVVFLCLVCMCGRKFVQQVVRDVLGHNMCFIQNGCVNFFSQENIWTCACADRDLESVCSCVWGCGREEGGEGAGRGEGANTPIPQKWAECESNKNWKQRKMQEMTAKWLFFFRDLRFLWFVFAPLFFKFCFFSMFCQFFVIFICRLYCFVIFCGLFFHVFFMTFSSHVLLWTFWPQTRAGPKHLIMECLIFDIWISRKKVNDQMSKKSNVSGSTCPATSFKFTKMGNMKKFRNKKVTTKSDFYFVFFVILLGYFFGNFSFVISPSGVWCCFTLLLLLRRVVCVLLLWVVLLSPSSARVVWLSLPPSFVWLPLPSFPWSGCCFHSLFWVVLLLIVLRGSVSVTSSSFWWCCLPSPPLDCVAFLPVHLWGGAALSGSTFTSFVWVVLLLFRGAAFSSLLFWWWSRFESPSNVPHPCWCHKYQDLEILALCKAHGLSCSLCVGMSIKPTASSLGPSVSVVCPPVACNHFPHESPLALFGSFHIRIRFSIYFLCLIPNSFLEFATHLGSFLLLLHSFLPSGTAFSSVNPTKILGRVVLPTNVVLFCMHRGFKVSREN